MKERITGEEGFTMTEIFTVFFIIFLIGAVCVVGFYGALCKGNFWYMEQSVERALQVDQPSAKVLKSERNIFAYSKILVQAGVGKEVVRYTVCLDSDVLWNYEFYAWDDVTSQCSDVVIK